MNTVLQFAVLGLGTGAVYALLGQGIVLIFRGSGVINLAHGGFAMVGAYLFNALHVDRGWPVLPAFVAVVAVVGAIGVLTDQGVLRRLRSASALSRLIATVGMLIVVQSIVVIAWGSTPILVVPLFSRGHTEMFGANVPIDRLWTLGAGVLVTAILMAVWRWTRLGWVTEAVSENQRSAAALGWSPELVSAATWGVGGALAAIAGVLVAPITQLDPVNLPLTVIAALAAALIGGFRSFTLTLAGGAALGAAQSLAGNYVHVTGAADALPLLVIVALLIVRGTSLPLRGHLSDRLPRVGSGQIEWRPLAVVSGATLVLLLTLSSANWLAALTATFAIAVILLSLVVLIGFAGQLSLGQYALAGIGALLAARTVTHVPFVVALLIGALGAMVLGLAFALPALRTRGVNLAVVTLALGLATNAVVFNNPKIVGDFGGVDIGTQSLFGLSIDPLDHPGRYAVLCFVVMVLCTIAMANLRRGRAGRRLLAMRANERAAAATGINVAAAKLYAFGVSGALAGVGGVLFAFQTTTVTFTAFSPLNALNAVAESVIGGVGLLIGPLLGATLAPASIGSELSLHWSSVDEYLPLVGGVGVLLTLVVHPDGIAGGNPITHLYRRLVPRRATPPPPPPPATVSRVEPRTLVLEELTVAYGPVVAVDHVSLTVRPGEIVGLIGPNGAGKTSLMDAVTGFASYTGTVRLDRDALDGWPAHRRARAGLVRSFQNLELFADLTVLENLLAAGDRRDAAAMLTDLVRPAAAELSPAAVAAVHEFGLADCLDRLPDQLPFGRRRLLAVARAVAMEPSVLLLDEPVAGLDEAESREFAELVRRLAVDWGMAILVIEHDMDFVMGLCDRLQVIDFGRPVATGTPREITENPAAIAAYLGEEAAPRVSPPLAGAAR